MCLAFPLSLCPSVLLSFCPSVPDSLPPSLPPSLPASLSAVNGACASYLQQASDAKEKQHRATLAANEERYLQKYGTKTPWLLVPPPPEFTQWRSAPPMDPGVYYAYYDPRRPYNR